MDLRVRRTRCPSLRAPSSLRFPSPPYSAPSALAVGPAGSQGRAGRGAAKNVQPGRGRGARQNCRGCMIWQSSSVYSESAHSTMCDQHVLGTSNSDGNGTRDRRRVRGGMKRTTRGPSAPSRHRRACSCHWPFSPGARDEPGMCTWANTNPAALAHGARRRTAHGDAGAGYAALSAAYPQTGTGAQRRQGALSSRRLLGRYSSKLRERRARPRPAGPGPRPTGCLTAR